MLIAGKQGRGICGYHTLLNMSRFICSVAPAAGLVWFQVCVSDSGVGSADQESCVMQLKELAKVGGAKFYSKASRWLTPAVGKTLFFAPWTEVWITGRQGGGEASVATSPPHVSFRMLCCPCVDLTDFMCVKSRMLLCEGYVYVYASRSPAE